MHTRIWAREVQRSRRLGPSLHRARGVENSDPRWLGELRRGDWFFFFPLPLLLLVIPALPSRPPLPAPGLSLPACYPPPPVPRRLEAAPSTGLLALPLLANLVFRRGVREQARRSSGGFSNPRPVGELGTPDAGLATVDWEWEPRTAPLLQLLSRVCSARTGTRTAVTFRWPRSLKEGTVGGLSASQSLGSIRGHRELLESVTRRVPFVNSQASIECDENLPKLIFERERGLRLIPRNRDLCRCLRCLTLQKLEEPLILDMVSPKTRTSPQKRIYKVLYNLFAQVPQEHLWAPEEMVIILQAVQ